MVFRLYAHNTLALTLICLVACSCCACVSLVSSCNSSTCALSSGGAPFLSFSQNSTACWGNGGATCRFASSRNFNNTSIISFRATVGRMILLFFFFFFSPSAGCWKYFSSCSQKCACSSSTPNSWRTVSYSGSVASLFMIFISTSSNSSPYVFFASVARNSSFCTQMSANMESVSFSKMLASFVRGMVCTYFPGGPFGSSNLAVRSVPALLIEST